MRLVDLRFVLTSALLVGLSLAYQNVVRAAAPDPSIVYAHGYYHITYTSADHIEMVRARTLRGLLIGKVRTVYMESNATRAGYMVYVCHQIGLETARQERSASFLYTFTDGVSD